MKRVFALMVVAAVCGGCSTVQPWQRGQLAEPTMAWDPDPVGAALTRHIHFSKEASNGSTGLAGGGCGCN